MVDPIRLLLLPYLQDWDGAQLRLRLLALPRGNPLDPLVDGAVPPAPSFATAALRFEVRLIAGLDALPSPTSPFTAVELASPAPAGAEVLFTELASVFPIDPAPPPASPRRAGLAIRKYAPPSYRTAVDLAGSRTPFLVTDDSYHCAIKAAPAKGFTRHPPPGPLPWGKVLAIALRQPALAEALGLVRPLAATVPDPALLAEGGWLSVTLAPTSDAHALTTLPGTLARYAARVPALTAARPLFTSVLFPVAPAATANYDELFQEVIDYDDGFAKAVHAVQPRALDPLLDEGDGSRPVRDLGIRIGWDDEQVTIWLNRQVDPAAATLDAPMGVFGYRVDARAADDPGTEWVSLCRAAGPIGVGPVAAGAFDGELAVETIPAQLEGERTGTYWLPVYYTQWSGPALVGANETAVRLAGAPAPTGPAGVRGIAPAIALRYGRSYELRVRLMDHTGGGPGPTAEPSNPAPHPTTTQPFRRWIRPGSLELVDPPPIVPNPADPPAALTVRRPRLGYPAYAFTGAPNAEAALLADLPAAKAGRREVSLPDPDVDRVQITVEVQTPDAVGEADFAPLFSTTRPFPADPAQPLTIPLSWVDVRDAATLAPAPTGPVTLPTARTVRITVAPLCREDPDLGYFGADDVRTGPSSFATVRRESDDERGLFLPASPADTLQCLFIRALPAVDGAVAAAQRAAGKGAEAPGSPLDRVAAETGLLTAGLTLRSRPGRRTVFGCSPALRHILAPDASGITFASAVELTQLWVVALRLTIDRDWSWDGLGPTGLAVLRNGAEVGRIEPRRSVHEEALRDPERAETDLVFFDAIDPKPAAGSFPAELEPTYRVVPTWAGTPAQIDPPLELEVRLPITTPPSQVPRLASAGIALSPYERTPAYDRSLPRQRVLWLEFTEPIANPADALFGRVLIHAADPVLLRTTPAVAAMPEPPLAVDPEPIRVIVPGQADDRRGLDAMQRLIPSDSRRHFGVPLPPGLEDGSPELFGFFTYEFRFGHARGWSTAQGRFGAPLRVTGVQHPAPLLECAVARDGGGIEASAPFAQPVAAGRSLLPVPPVTELWVMLYAQVMQLDGSTGRNVLLGHRPARLRRLARGEPPLSGVLHGAASWSNDEVGLLLEALTLGPETPLSCLAVETLPGERPQADPLGADLGHERLLRTSPLVPVPAICCC